MDRKTEDIMIKDLSAEDLIRLCRKDGYALRGCVSLAGTPGESVCRDAVNACLEDGISPEGLKAADACSAAGLGSALFFAFSRTGEKRWREALDEMHRVLKARFPDGNTARERVTVQPFFAAYDVLFGGRRDAAGSAALFLKAHPLYAGVNSAPGWYLAALIDTVDGMDEQIYEHYRAAADLFRQAAAPKETDSALYIYALLKGVRLHLLDGDLYQPVIKKAFSRLGQDSPEGPGAYLLALSEYRRQRWNY